MALLRSIYLIISYSLALASLYLAQEELIVQFSHEASLNLHIITNQINNNNHNNNNNNNNNFISQLFLKDDSPQHDPGDADNRESSAVGPSIRTCSNSGTTDAMLLTNQALDSASQPNEAPDSAHESRNQLLFIYSF